jgi:hypothetical protein
MNKREFVAKAKKSGLEYLLSYKADGSLASLDFENEGWCEKAILGIFKHIPPNLVALEFRNKQADHPFAYIETTEFDLTFEGFYKMYPVKQGKRIQAQNAWAKMNDTDKAMAIGYIPILMQIKRNDGTSLPYASTYLNQKYWL